MEEKKEKKKLDIKFILICFALGIVLFFASIFDIKANAAEGKLLEVVNYSSSGEESVSFSTTLNYTEEYELYWYSPSDTYYTGYYEVFLYVVSKQHSSLGNDYDYAFVMNDETYYVTILHTSSTTMESGYKAPRIDGVTVSRIDKGYYHAEFVEHYMNGNIKPDVDYDNLNVNENIGVVGNLKVNKLNDTKFLKNQIIYDYLTWSNTENLELQVQYQPVVKIYNNSKYEIYLREYAGEWTESQILSKNTYNFLCGMDVVGSTVDEDSLVNKDTWDYFRNIYGNSDYYDWSGFDAEFPEFCYRYRIRYVDTDNLEAGRWMYVNPTTLYEQYESYVEEIDNSQNIVDGILDGSKIDIDDIGLESGIESIENENAFKDKYDIVDGEVDTQEAVNWLNTVVNFIKDTPQVVGSVLGFLPQPILYGMYVCIFLSVIASGIAIVKALF